MSPAPAGTSRRDRTAPRALLAFAPALVYLGVRLVGVLILVLMAGPNNTTVHRSLTAWDGQWYLGIATGGYTGAPEGLLDAHGQRTPQTPLAFFPGYPTVTGWLADLTWLSVDTAAFVVSILAGIAAAYALVRIGMLIRGGSRRVGLILVALFAASPMGVVLSMTYSEALFCALAAWSLVFVLRRQWMWAGVLCALAGLVRPTGLALVLAVGAAAFACAVEVRRRGGLRPALRPLGGLLLAPMGLVGYLWWAGAQIRPGAGVLAQLGGWSELQERGWNSAFDGGAATLRFTGEAIARSESVHEIGTILVLLAAVALVVVGFVLRVEWPLLVYGLGVLIMDLGSNGLMNSKARLLLPAFTLLIPVALGLAKRKPATTLVVLVATTVVSGWFGAHALVTWPYAI
ncbi:glycosyltransferase family 39 protein [Haloechinothrix salitolerans]